VISSELVKRWIENALTEWFDWETGLVAAGLTRLKVPRYSSQAIASRTSIALIWYRCQWVCTVAK
jgi:hypothetical protein